MEKLYKLNNDGKPYEWQAWLDEDQNGERIICCSYGIVGGQLIHTSYRVTQKNALAELNSKYDAKRKQGYINIEDIRDDDLPGSSPVEDGANPSIEYLTTYLKANLNNQNTGAILPMLCKTYNGNIWKKTGMCSVQPKINGLRCLITAYNKNDMFKPVGLRFQSREGIYWDSLDDLEDALLYALGNNVDYILENNIVLDGELYIPGKSVNEINHAVKTPNCPENKLLQYWCYDIAVDDASYEDRVNMRIDATYHGISGYDTRRIKSLDDHLNNKKRLVYVSDEYIHKDEQAVQFRDLYIGLGFEGCVLRNCDMPYQFGRRRANYMEKFKSATDGIFEIIAIDKEQKRDLLILTCRNDVNDATFETRFSYSFDRQIDILNNKEQYIGKKVFIKFGERSGVSKVPFHIKDVVFDAREIND